MIEKLRRFLAWLPSTNALVLTTIGMALATTVRALGPKWVCGPIPEGWYTFVLGFATIALVQFTAKRATQHKDNGNGGPVV
jgi:multisubunit Na+/H+ antiporter MnhC subunit